MKNNFPFRPHWKKPEEPKAAPETSQYLPRAVELTVEQHKPEEGLRVLLEGFAHYFNCPAEALGPYPLAEQIEKVVKLPPVDFYAASKQKMEEHT